MAALEAILITGTTTSCKKDMFKQDVYDSIMKQEFPIDPVDAAHSWNLTTRRTATVNITDTDIRPKGDTFYFFDGLDCEHPVF